MPDAADYMKKPADELRKLASERGISGRSEMNKEELAHALAAGEAADDPASVQQRLESLESRVTTLELQASGTIPANPIPQRR